MGAPNLTVTEVIRLVCQVACALTVTACAFSPSEIPGDGQGPSNSNTQIVESANQDRDDSGFEVLYRRTKSLAEAGDPLAQSHLALVLQGSESPAVPQNHCAALAWAVSAVRSGAALPSNFRIIARAYREGRFIPPDPTKAALYGWAATKGYKTLLEQSMANGSERGAAIAQNLFNLSRADYLADLSTMSELHPGQVRVVLDSLDAWRPGNDLPAPIDRKACGAI